MRTATRIETCSSEPVDLAGALQGRVEGTVAVGSQGGSRVRHVAGLALLVFAATSVLGTVGCGSTATDRGEEPSTQPEESASNDGADSGGMAESDQGPDSGRLVSQDGADGGEDALLDDIRRDADRRKAEAKFLADQGDRQFADGEFERAEDLYRRALELDPSLDETKRKRTQAMMFLGMRDAEIRSAMREFSREVEVRQEQRLAETRQLIEQGDEFMARDNIELALRQYTRARQNLLWFDYGVDTGELSDEVEQKFEDARKKKDELEAQLRDQQVAETAEQARLELERAEERRQERIARLARRSRESMVNKEYETAISLSDEVLTLDPENRRAKTTRKRAKELLQALEFVRVSELDRRETQESWDNLAEAAIPYQDSFRFTDDEDYWRGQVQRRAAEQRQIEFQDSFEVQKIKRTLATVRSNFSFDNDPLSEVVNFLRTIADLNITVDPEIDQEDTPVDLKLEGVRLQEALDLILANTNLSYTYRYDTLFITTPDKAFGDTRFATYTVSDILNQIKDFPGPTIRVKSNDETDDGAAPFGFDSGDEDDTEPLTPEDLADLIRESTGGDEAWDASRSEIVGNKGQLLVTATKELHLEVQRFLDDLRKDSDLFVIVETRFIDMLDDFLEDIGVDSRSLGGNNGNFGTGYGAGQINSGRTGGIDAGFMNLGNPTNPSLVQGLDRTAGRIQHILDGFVGAARGSRLDSALRGLTLQVTWLDPFQINAILRASSERREARTVTAPRVTASNGQRVHVSVITQRSYVQDYELVSGGTGLVVAEVADPVVATFQDGVILDVRPTISADRKYITLDVRPTLADLVNGIISSVTVSLGSLVQAATLVEIDLPEITLQQAYTSVTVPDGGTVLLGGFRSLNERKYESFVPFVGRLPIVKNLFRRKAYLSEKRSLYILLRAEIVDLRAEERDLFN